jgi:hypothetical protein
MKCLGDAILERLREGTMPCDGAWPPEHIAVFQRWIAGGVGALTARRGT